MPENRVKFGLKNLYYALAKISEEDNTATYSAPVRWPGAVSLSMAAQGGESKFYADDGIYLAVTANNGYSGDLEAALVPESFLLDVLHETKDANGVIVDDTNAVPECFALLFEFQGDRQARRHVLYNCTASRPDVASKTKGESIEPQTEKVTITAAPIHSKELGRDMSKASVSADKEVYKDWFKTVYVPKAVSEQEPEE